MADYTLKVALDAENKVDGSKVKKELQKIGKEGGEALDKGVAEGAKKSQKGVKDLEKQVDKSGKSIKKQFIDRGQAIKTGIAGAVAYVTIKVGRAMLSAAKSALHLADRYEQAVISFTTMLGSGKAARQMLSDLTDFAAKTPFDLPGVRQNAKQLLAMGVEADKVIPTLKALGDVSSGTGADLERLAMNYGQVITQGKLTGRELKDFLVNGVPLLDELAKNAGKSKEEIQELIGDGEISANDVTRAFQTMTSEGGKFDNMMGKISSGTFTGAWSNFMDTLSQKAEQFGGRFVPALTSTVRRLDDLVSRFDTDSPTYFAEQIAHVNEELDKLRSEKQSVADKIEELNRLFDEGAIGSEEFSKQLDGLLNDEDRLIKTQAELNDELDMYKTKQEKAAEVNDYYLKKKKELQNQLDEEKISYEEHAQLSEQARTNRDLEIIKIEEATKMHLSYISANGKLASMMGETITVSDETAMTLLALRNATAQADHAFEQVSTATSQEQFLALKAAALEALRALAIAQQGLLAETKNIPANLMSPKAYQKAMKTSINLMQTQGRIAKLESSSMDDFKSSVKGASGAVDDLNKSMKGGGGGGAKDQTKQLMKELEKQRDLRIESIQDSILSEEEKMKKLAEIKEWYDRELIQLEGKTNDELLKEAEEYMKEKKKQYKEDVDENFKAMEKSADAIDGYLDKIEEIKDKYDEVRKEVIQNIRDIDHELGELDAENVENLTTRFVEVQKTLKEIEREHGSIQGLASSISDNTIKTHLDAGGTSLGGIELETLQKYKKLQEELSFIISQTTEEQRAQAEATDKLTESERQYNEYLAERAVLEEKRAINDAFRRQTDLGQNKIFYDKERDVYTFEDEKGAIQDITDYQNEKLAQQLLDKQLKLQQEHELEEQHIKETYNIYKTHQEKMKSLRKSNTDQFIQELRKREQAARATAAAIQRMNSMYSVSPAQARRAYGGTLNMGKVTLVGENGPEKVISRMSSYVQPTNSITTNTTTNSLAINGVNVGNFNTVDDVLDMLRTRLSRHF